MNLTNIKAALNFILPTWRSNRVVTAVAGVALGSVVVQLWVAAPTVREMAGEVADAASFLLIAMGTARIISKLWRPLREVRRHGKLQVSASEKSAVPRLGELLICIFVPRNRQVEFLGDFEELFTNVWFPKFGPNGARLLYIAHALRSAIGIVGIAAIGAIVDRVWRMIRPGG